MNSESKDESHIGHIVGVSCRTSVLEEKPMGSSIVGK